jgi:hypothetical protein
MTTILYQEWIIRWDDELRTRDRYILLLQDNFSAHVPTDTLTNICVVNFSPNLTAQVQRLDAGIIRCFKAHYRSRYMQAAIDNYDTGVSLDSRGSILVSQWSRRCKLVSPGSSSSVWISRRRSSQFGRCRGSA